MSGRTRQLDLFAKKRKAASRRRGPSSKDRLLPHVARPEHRAEHPVHVSIRRVALAPSFRAQRVCSAIVGEISDAKSRGVRVVHYSVQDNHLHLMVEGRDSADLSRQMRTLFSRIAMAVNRVARRFGKVFRDRHHRHELRTPTETRNALVYILFNDRKHAGGRAPSSRATTANPRDLDLDLDLDLCSSALWFNAWDRSVPLPPFTYDEMKILASDMDRPTIEPETWLARIGWRRGGGLVRFNEHPRMH